MHECLETGSVERRKPLVSDFPLFRIVLSRKTTKNPDVPSDQQSQYGVAMNKHLVAQTTSRALLFLVTFFFLFFYTALSVRVVDHVCTTRCRFCQRGRPQRLHFAVAQQRHGAEMALVLVVVHRIGAGCWRGARHWQSAYRCQRTCEQSIASQQGAHRSALWRCRAVCGASRRGA